MYNKNLINLVITEDSDLLVFGVKRALFKMNQNGYGFEIDLNNLERCESFKFTQQHDLFLKTCILSGCDYLESIKGIGFKKALKLVKENKGDIKQIIEKIKNSGLAVQDNYI